MSTLLDKRAEKVRFAGGEQAKRNVAARLAEQKKRVAAANARDRALQQARRDNGVKAVDIFGKKQAATEAAAQAQKADDAPRAVQQPKTEGPLAGRVIGAIDKAKLEQLRGIVDGLNALGEILQAAFEAWARVHDKFDSTDEDIQECGTQIVRAQTGVPGAIDFDELVKVFRARKGEDQ